ncbi:MAG: ribosome recycling factor [Phycisphaerae bacterium]|nr:ribosome recycling factor [Phycisphaerae bacterium]
MNEVLKDCEKRMVGAIDALRQELSTLRTGRASVSILDEVKVEYYGTPTDLRELAAISVPEPTQLLVKPFDPGGKNDIVKALETADLGLNPQVDGNAIRINIPAPSRERRMQLVNQVKKMAEDARVAIRNERRDAIKQIDQLVKDKENHVSEDEGKDAKSDIDELTKAHTKLIDEHCAKKAEEIEQI